MLLAVKDELVTTWSKLSPVHQASMALVLLDKRMAREGGRWTREAIALKWLQVSPALERRDSILTQWRKLSPDEQAGRRRCRTAVR